MFNKNTNFNKNETESKMENPPHSFWEMNLVLQLIWESQIKSKTVMSWSSWKKKEGILFTIYFVYCLYTVIWYISWSPNSQQPLKHRKTQNIWHCALTLLIRKTLDFWSIMFLVFLACKHELLFQKWGNLVLY